jgi:hypothetical protein
LFEGVIQYDLALALKQLSQAGVNTVSYFYLIQQTETFSFIGNNAHDKPGVVLDGKNSWMICCSKLVFTSFAAIVYVWSCKRRL